MKTKLRSLYIAAVCLLSFIFSYAFSINAYAYVPIDADITVDCLEIPDERDNTYAIKIESENESFPAPRSDKLEISDEEWNEWLYNNLRITSAGDKYFNSGMTLNFDARLSLTYNFGRYFVNIFGQFNNMRYHHENSRGNMNDWSVHTSIGLRL